MGKAKSYGLKTAVNPRLRLDLRYLKQQHQRRRENAPRKQVAAKTQTDKEAKE